MKKGDQTKQIVMEAARKLFIEKGYSAVTMTDLCEETKLSRGGLYRHFSSTKDIFIQLLEGEKRSAEQELDQAMKEGVDPISLVHRMLEDQKKLILTGGGELIFTVHQFSKKESLGKMFLKKRYIAALDMLKKLIRYGQEKGVFIKGEPEQISEFIVQFFNGLQVSAESLGFTEEELEKRLLLVFDYLVKEEKRK